MSKKTKISKLCQKCGMCCDGTLFDRTKSHEEIDLLESLPKLVPVENGASFEQPCPYFNKICTIYHQKKPKVCDVFFCKQIKLYKKEVLTYDQVDENITKLKKLIQELNILITEHNYIEFEGLALRKIQKLIHRYETELGAVETRSRYRFIYLHLYAINKLVKQFK